MRNTGVWLIALAGSVPFLNQAVQVDDPYYLGHAYLILQHPWDPLGGELPWGGGDGFYGIPNPPLWSYVLAAVAWATNWNDLALHAASGLTFVALTFGIFALLERQCPRPHLWTAVITLSPFLFPGRNLMHDIPLAALWVWCLVFAFKAWEEDRLRPALWAGTLAGLATVTKYTGLLLPIILTFGAVRFRRPKSLVALVPASLIFTAWCAHNSWCYGVVHAVWHLGGAGGAATMKDVGFERLQILARGIGAVIWLTPLLVGAVGGFQRRFIAIAFGGLLACGLYGWFDLERVHRELLGGGFSSLPLRQAHYFVFAANGIAVLAAGSAAVALGRLFGAGDARCKDLLLFWAALGLGFNLFGLSNIAFGAVRHYQSFLIPALLLTSPAMDDWLRRSRGSRFVGYGALATSAAVAFGIALADLESSVVHRRFARDLIGQRNGIKTVWYAGDPSFRYYADSAGGKFLNFFDQQAWSGVQPGDFLVIPCLQTLGLLGRPELQNALIVDNQIIKSMVPLKTVAHQTNFYGSSRVTLPWELTLIDDGTGKWWPPIVAPVQQFIVYEMPF